MTRPTNTAFLRPLMLLLAALSEAVSGKMQMGGGKQLIFNGKEVSRI